LCIPAAIGVIVAAYSPSHVMKAVFTAYSIMMLVAAVRLASSSK
jgi:hypothetical protein